jgi:hypothetical protein
MQAYPIGSPGIPWDEDDKKAWLKLQDVKRSYAQEVLAKYENISSHFVKTQYGALPINKDRYPLFAFTSAKWDNNKQCVLVTGGVHGYETSGVQGAISFLHKAAASYLTHFNFIIVPCVSPWGYETINRWTSSAIDPNRSFYANSPSYEAEHLMQFVNDYMAVVKQKLTLHIDLHETTDTDNSEFRPALAARDGVILDDWEVPDGFYTVANTSNPKLSFQKAVVESVAKVTHIAPNDANMQIIGVDVESTGVICYDKQALYLCGGFTNADYVTTTEVYPDSPQASAQSCIEAQVAAITGGLNYLIAN